MARGIEYELRLLRKKKKAQEGGQDVVGNIPETQAKELLLLAKWFFAKKAGQIKRDSLSAGRR